MADEQKYDGTMGVFDLPLTEREATIVRRVVAEHQKKLGDYQKPQGMTVREAFEEFGIVTNIVARLDSRLPQEGTLEAVFDQEEED